LTNAVAGIKDKAGIVGLYCYPVIPPNLEHRKAPLTNRYRHRIKR
jgi:hypothetical protein